ncbi:hypothetical protein FRC16_006504 [Serendipita sp. 398]|nr:hypothetical protein FRC16_006504 [Serendipita sp. 398]
MSTVTSDAEKGTRHHEDFTSSSPTPVAPALPQYRQFANPTPLGLCSFALTTFVLSLINLQTRGVTITTLFRAWSPTFFYVDLDSRHRNHHFSPDVLSFLPFDLSTTDDVA